MQDNVKLLNFQKVQTQMYPSPHVLYDKVISDAQARLLGVSIPEKHVLGEFEAVGFLGKGAFSKVFLCKNRSNHYVALKLSYLDDQTSFEACLSELELQEHARKNDIRCVIPYLEGTTSIHELKKMGVSELTSDAARFVMPVGMSFKTFITDYLTQKSGKLSVEEAYVLLYDMFSLLVELHRYNIIHRDIKMENLLLATASSGLPQLMLSDFGTARQFKKSGLYTQRFQTEIYTPLQLRGGDSLYSTLSVEDSKKHDVYSVAIIAYQILDNFIIKGGHENTSSYRLLASEPYRLNCPKNCPDNRLWKILKPIIKSTTNIANIPTAEEVCCQLDRVMFSEPKKNKESKIAYCGYKNLSHNNMEKQFGEFPDGQRVGISSKLESCSSSHQKDGLSFQNTQHPPHFNRSRLTNVKASESRASRSQSPFPYQRPRQASHSSPVFHSSLQQSEGRQLEHQQERTSFRITQRPPHSNRSRLTNAKASKSRASRSQSPFPYQQPRQASHSSPVFRSSLQQSEGRQLDHQQERTSFRITQRPPHSNRSRLTNAKASKSRASRSQSPFPYQQPRQASHSSPVFRSSLQQSEGRQPSHQQERTSFRITQRPPHSNRSRLTNLKATESRSDRAHLSQRSRPNDSVSKSISFSMGKLTNPKKNQSGDELETSQIIKNLLK